VLGLPAESKLRMLGAVVEVCVGWAAEEAEEVEKERVRVAVGCVRVLVIGCVWHTGRRRPEWRCGCILFSWRRASPIPQRMFILSRVSAVCKDRENY
jgi:hypothetical protein